MITLWARARETLRQEPLFKDTRAVEWSELMDYDFEQFNDAWKILTSIAIRTWILDKEISGYLEHNPEATIINLGAGFDNRFWRVDNGSILWFDIDLPTVIDQKRQMIKETSRYRMIGKSIQDFTWRNELETASRPIAIIAEGVLMYLKESEISDLFDVLVRAYPGADIFLELLAPGLVDSQYQDTANTMKAGYKWSLLNGRDLKSLHAKVQFLEEWCVLDFFRERWGWIGKCADFPMFRNYFGEKIVHIKIR